MSVTYAQAVPVVFGMGAIAEIAEEAKKLGGTKVMVVYTSDLAQSAAVKGTHDSLEAAGMPYVDYDGVVPDPPVACVDAGAELARAEGADCLVAVGGGSSMDAAKAMAVVLTKGGSIVNYLQDPPLPVDLEVPVIMVPTTAGTGSEVSTVAVISNPAANTKPAIAVHGALALIDPELTASMPPRLTVNTGMDVLCHSMETMTGKDNKNPLSTALARDAIQRVFEYLPRAAADGSDLEARENMAIAANFAGVGISNNHCHLGHAVADSFSAAFHTPHGLNCIWGEAEVFRLVAPAVPEEMRDIARCMGLELADDAPVEAVADAVADAVYDLMRRCGVASLAECGFAREDVVACADHIMANFLVTHCPMDVTREQVVELLGKIYDTYRREA